MQVYGPSISSISNMIVSPWLQLFLAKSGKLNAFRKTNAKPFLFHPGRSSSKPHASAQWCRVVQNCFGRHSEEKIKLPPKNLRFAAQRPRCIPRTVHLHLPTPNPVCRSASFVTFVKGQKNKDGLVDVLKSASVAMRHSETMQACRIHMRAILQSHKITPTFFFVRTGRNGV